ncbi:hypothetical protein HB364_10420 [Pseudoflavitalea sp. X16]|uniref:hypothetical protein n=1 Tax=Paraflavitalea devenefica TaxID=2716334 RepID=UPI001421C90B|nr:hypothetical protein [Paraflavitalea devenefica]NII25498.1 hypothetical protein [Paraflavitalea devenefica]
MRQYYLICYYLLALSFPAAANNLRIGPVTETVAGSDHFLHFTISWENSWRITGSPGNRDAVWLFVKRRDCSAVQWLHANLGDQDSAHSAGTPLFVDAYADKKGVMIYRSTTGTGSIDSVSIQLKLDAPPAGDYEYKVFGIEMVYINEGAFYLGDGVSTYRFKTGTTDDPYLITSEGAITMSNSGSNLWSTSNTSGSFTLPDAYPKGYNAFYCMKYELSQGQYADFLNAISNDAFLNRYDAAHIGLSRYTISGTWPAMVASAPDRACNWVGIEDLIAYLDWAALSPMTELEFEKICRGANTPVAAEFAWGTSGITNADTITTGTDGMPNETISNYIAPGTGPALYNISGPRGPLRCGFAAKASTSRVEAGAAYYGVMEMSGNVLELCYNADSSMFGKGPSFNGSHGDGELSITPNAGYANAGWPGQTPGDINTQYYTFTARGGAWSSQFSGIFLRTSDRNAHIINTSVPSPDGKGRSHSFSGRGVSRRQ